MPLPINEAVNEGVAVLKWLAPASVNGATVTLGPFNLTGIEKVLFILDVGAIAGGATVDAKVQASLTSGGTYADVAGAAITQVTATPTKPIGIEVKGETLAAAGQGPFLKLLVTGAVAAVVVGARALVCHTAYAPASDYGVGYKELVSV